MGPKVNLEALENGKISLPPGSRKYCYSFVQVVPVTILTELFRLRK